MPDTSYTYSVARIRSLEPQLLNDAAIEQLLSCRTHAQCLQLLAEKGWGSPELPQTAEAILEYETEKTWQVVRDLPVDPSVFDVLSYQKLFHNLKAAVKNLCTQDSVPGIYFDGTAVSGEELEARIREKNYAELPELLRAAAQEAYETLLQTRDGQLCDVIIDRAALDAIGQAGRKADEPVIRDYAESTVAVADIKIAARCAATGKSREFTQRALSEVTALDTEKLAEAAFGGTKALCDYLQSTDYADAAEPLAASPSAFERWCDDRVIDAVRPQLFNPFGAGPVFAYLLARENEIKTVRIILTGKQNELSEESVRQRVRRMYV